MDCILFEIGLEERKQVSNYFSKIPSSLGAAAPGGPNQGYQNMKTFLWFQNISNANKLLRCGIQCCFCAARLTQPVDDQIHSARHTKAIDFDDVEVTTRYVKLCSVSRPRCRSPKARAQMPDLKQV